MLRVIDIWNRAHHGDVIMLFHYLAAMAKVEPSISWRLYVNSSLLHLSKLAPSNTILFSDIDRPWNCIDTWIGTDDPWFVPYFSRFDVYHLSWWRRFSLKLDVKCPFTGVDDLLFTDSRIGDMAKQVEPYDVLIINCQTYSGQIDNIQHTIWPRIVELLRSRNLSNIKSIDLIDGCQTEVIRNQNLDLYQIGGVATKATMVIGSITGPTHACFNTWSPVGQRWFLADKLTCYTFERFKFCHVTSLDKLFPVLEHELSHEA